MASDPPDFAQGPPPKPKKYKPPIPENMQPQATRGLVKKRLNGAEVPTSWEPDVDLYITNANGVIKPIFGNFVTMFRMEGGFWDLWFDEFAMRHMMGRDPIRDADIRRMTEWAHQRGIPSRPAQVAEAVWRVAELTPRNPVLLYLNSLAWDKVPRIDQILIDHAGAKDEPIVRAMTGKFLIQAVARAFTPGCEARSTLILEGEQFIGKSAFFRTLFGSEYFTDQLPNLEHKDSLIQLRGVWCLEHSELATLNMHDASRVKQFLSCRVDRYRDPFGIAAADWPRTCVFGASVNPDGSGYLNDPTGATRFWPIACNTEIDNAAVAANRDQYWAEAVHRHNAGEAWYIIDDGLRAAAKMEQAERAESDLWDEMVENYVRGKAWVTTLGIMQDGLGVTDRLKMGRREQRKIGSILTRLGWRRTTQRVNHKPTKGYFKPNTPTQIQPAEDQLPMDL